MYVTPEVPLQVDVSDTRRRVDVAELVLENVAEFANDVRSKVVGPYVPVSIEI